MKGKFIILFITLSLILVFTTGFIYFIHIPYTKQVKDINGAKNMVLSTNELEDLDEFFQYNSHVIYYIGLDDTNIYVFNASYQLIHYEDITNLNEELVRETLANTYGISSIDHLELGYENKTVCYVCVNETSSSIQYIYLNANDATEIKSYNLES